MNQVPSFPSDTDPYSILQYISDQISLAEGPVAIREILLHLFRNSHLKNKLLSQLTELPVPILAAARNELIKMGILQTITEFTEVGRQWVKHQLGFTFTADTLKETDLTTVTKENIATSIFSTKILNDLEKWIKKRPTPLFELDQSRATFDTQIKRVLLLLNNGDIEGQRLLFLGDDDATSLLVSLLKVKCQIFVVDIDDRILSYLVEASNTLGGTPITSLVHDLREPLPDAWQHSFDVVFTDPPYTLPGARLFFQRGFEALHRLSNKLYLSFGAKEPEVLWNLQLACLNAGFQFWDIHRGFNKYIGNLKLGQFSHLFIFKTIQPPSLIAQYVPVTYQGKLYTADMPRKKDKPGKWSDYAHDYFPTTVKDRAIGYHLVEEFYDVDPETDLLINPQELHKFLLDSCKISNLTVVDSFKYIYPPYGTSIIVVLSESHISMHTWPEHHYISVDIFICDDPAKAHLLIDTLKKSLNPGHTEELRIFRGQRS